jgi:hypothetical protein
MPNHFLLRIGDGAHFNTSSLRFIWGINSDTSPLGKWFKSTAREGDLLWFVTSKSKGQIVAVATFTGAKERVLGPLIALTATNDELGWNCTEGSWDTEVHYKDLYNLTHCNLFSDIKGPSTIRLYSEKCKVNLIEEYLHIVRYSKLTTSMHVSS